MPQQPVVIVSLYITSINEELRSQGEGSSKPMTRKQEVRVRRACDESMRGDGIGVLVDRIWPRGHNKEMATSTSGARRSRLLLSYASGTPTTLVH